MTDMNEKIEAALEVYGNGARIGETLRDFISRVLAAAPPPLRAREEIARALYEHEFGYQRVEYPTFDDPRNTEGCRKRFLERADVVLALSSTAGQEWREPEGWNTTSNARLEVKLRDYKEKLAAEIGSSIEAKIKTGSKNVFDIGHEIVEGYLVQSLLKVALSAAPPVAEKKKE